MQVEHSMAGRSVILSTEKLFKVLVIGDVDVGKTSIILQYVNKRFDKEYKSTIGVDFALKTIEWDARTLVRLQLWDIAGECPNYEVPVVVLFVVPYLIHPRHYDKSVLSVTAI